jgi:hypothetical protein
MYCDLGDDRKALQLPVYCKERDLHLPAATMLRSHGSEQPRRRASAYPAQALLDIPILSKKEGKRRPVVH